jgi:hypothetical protein
VAKVAGNATKQGSSEVTAPPSLLSSFAWLIPSFAAFLIANGFIVQSAQEDLLGLAIYARNSQSYLNTSADFIRDVTIGLIDGIYRWHLPEIVRTHPRLFLAAASAAAAITLLCWAPATHSAVWLTRLAERFGHWSRARVTGVGKATTQPPGPEKPDGKEPRIPARPRRDLVTHRLRKQPSATARNLLSDIPPLIVLALVLMRVAVVDVPILRIGGLATRSEGSCWSLAADSAPSPGRTPDVPPGLSDDEKQCPAIASAKGYDRIAWNQARKVAAEIVCSRGSTILPRLQPVFSERQECQSVMTKGTLGEVNEARSRIRDLGRDEFYADLLLTIVTCILALASWYNSRTALFPKLAVSIALISSLTVPYVYGKVAAPEEFDLGELRITPTLADKYNELGNFVSEHGWIQGFIVQRDQGNIELLAIRRFDCGTDTQKAWASLSMIPTSQVLSFDEVRRIDIIGWLIDEQHKCK